jgi:hypothetical protein
MAPKNIFICYRRDDAAGYARSIYDRLNARFPNRVFMDVEGIIPGADYSQVIQQTVGTCHALLAIIGKSWASMVDGANQRRIDLADDYVRHEIGTALRRNIPVIPVLVNKAEMPTTKVLPPDLASLSLREAIEISDGDFNHDCDRLIAAIERQFGEVRYQPPPTVANTGGRNTCLIFGLIGALVVGGIVVVLFLLGLLAASSNQNTDRPAPDQGYSQRAANPGSSQAPASQPTDSAPSVSDDTFDPVGRWIVTFENNGVAIQNWIVIYANHTFQSEDERGRWEYDAATRTLTLSGWLMITIDNSVDGEFVGHGMVEDTSFPVKLKRN